MHSTRRFLKQRSPEVSDLFDWETRKGAAGKRSRVEGARRRRRHERVLRPDRAATTDCCVVKPDGTLYVQSGIGNLGTESVIDVHRVAAEMLGVPWDKVVVTWGDTRETCRGPASRAAARRRRR